MAMASATEALWAWEHIDSERQTPASSAASSGSAVTPRTAPTTPSTPLPPQELPISTPPVPYNEGDAPTPQTPTTTWLSTPEPTPLPTPQSSTRPPVKRPPPPFPPLGIIAPHGTPLVKAPPPFLQQAPLNMWEPDAEPQRPAPTTTDDPYDRNYYVPQITAADYDDVYDDPWLYHGEWYDQQQALRTDWWGHNHAYNVHVDQQQALRTDYHWRGPPPAPTINTVTTPPMAPFAIAPPTPSRTMYPLTAPTLATPWEPNHYTPPPLLPRDLSHTTATTTTTTTGPQPATRPLVNATPAKHAAAAQPSVNPPPVPPPVWWTADEYDGPYPGHWDGVPWKAFPKAKPSPFNIVGL